MSAIDLVLAQDPLFVEDLVIADDTVEDLAIAVD